ncbi:MAG: C-type lectin domain-containing protein, partial [Rhodoluna sp.]
MIRRLFKGTVVASAIALLAFAGSTTSMAASKVTVDLPNSAVTGGESAPLPIMLTGFTYDALTVTLVSDAGNLTVADPDAKLTLNPGYPSLADQTEIAFHGATADVVSILESGVTWTAPGDATTSTSLALKVQVGEFQEGTTYDPATGHTYKYINTGASWIDAQNAAKAMTYKGKSGYLANITTSEENDFIAIKSGADNVWFGGTADINYVNAARVAAGQPALPGGTDTQGNGNYYWGAGDESGANFTNGLETPAAVGSAFNGWAEGEPNDWGGSEGCAVTNWAGVPGKWNDLNCT